jgi:hypothetical protein
MEIRDWQNLIEDLPVDAKKLCLLGIEFSKKADLEEIRKKREEIFEKMVEIRKIYSQIVYYYISLVKKHEQDKKSIELLEKDLQAREKRIIEAEEDIYASKEKEEQLRRFYEAISRMNDTISLIYMVLKDTKELWEGKSEKKIKFVRGIIVKRIFLINSLCQRIINFINSYYSDSSIIMFASLIREFWREKIAKYLSPREEKKILEKFTMIKRVLDLKKTEKKVEFTTKTELGRELEISIKNFLTKIDQEIITTSYYFMPTYYILEERFKEDEIREYLVGLTKKDVEKFWKIFAGLAVKRALPVEILKEKEEMKKLL